MNKYKGMKRLTLALLAFLILPLVLNVFSVQAGSGDGAGGRPSVGQWGYWWNSSDVRWKPGMNGTPAWHNFYNKQIKFRTDKKLKDAINKAGGATGGFQNPDGTYQTLVESCQKSEHIWWYGANPLGSSYGPEEWFTQGGNTNSTGPGWEAMSEFAYEDWVKYKAHPKSRWKNGNVILVCSGAYFQETKPNLFFQANSGTFEYDGTPKTVSGVDTAVSNYSQLKPEHEWKANPTRSAINKGEYDVPFPKSLVKIYNKKNGVEVTEKYNITTKIGKLIIEGDIPPPPDETGDDWRCVQHAGDSATAYAFNTTTGSYGFTPSGAPGLNGTYEERDTPAGIFAGNNSPPSRYDSLSTWESWKSVFENGSDIITPDLDLESAGVSGILSQYGGVYNIMRSLREDTYNITHCQPQTRELEEVTYWDEDCYTNEDGGYDCSSYSWTEWEWTEWEDEGSRIVWTNSGPHKRYDKFNYQILSVNCNKSGFNSVLSSTGGTKLSDTPGDGGASLQTPEEEGVGPGPLGKSGTETGKDSFYNDGVACKEAFWCTVKILPGADNDAGNNFPDEPLFVEEQDTNTEGDHGKPFENNLIFFRDNEDRQVHANIWYPRETNLDDLITFPGDNADYTTVNLYGGTPELELTKIAPWGQESRYLWDLGETEFRGNVNRFLMKSQWASDKGKPYEMGINWQYEGKGTNIVPSIVDGYEIKDMTNPYEYYFDVYCEFKNKKGDYQANIPDTPFAWGTTSPKWEDISPKNAIRTLFTRSVSDTQR